MPFIHLPVQSGSNKILKTMNRKHTREEYLAKINDLISARPEIRFSSDFIVGYPGETEKDFNDTISLVKQIKFLNSFSFIYNKRPGTPTSKQISINEHIQKKRLIILQNLLSDIQIKENSNQVGKLKKVLIENKMKNQTSYFGRLENFTPVIIEKVTNSDIGKIINVRINDFNKNNLFGVKENIEKCSCSIMLEAKNLDKEISVKKIDNETVNVKIFNNDILMSIVGEFNKNLIQIEKLTKTKLYFRGNSITVKGDRNSVSNVSNSLMFLVNKFLVTNSIENNDIIYSVKHGVNELDKKNRNNIRSIDQVIKTPRRSIIARSKKQSDYLKALQSENIVMSLGPAGTGKSYLAVSVAVTMLMEKKLIG